MTRRRFSSGPRGRDLSQPVAVLLIAVLHFIGEEDDPYAIVRRLMAAVPPGSYLVIAHAGSDIPAAEMDEGIRAYNTRSPVTMVPRSREQIDRLIRGARTGRTRRGPAEPVVRAWPAGRRRLCSDGVLRHHAEATVADVGSSAR